MRLSREVPIKSSTAEDHPFPDFFRSSILLWFLRRNAAWREKRPTEARIAAAYPFSASDQPSRICLSQLTPAPPKREIFSLSSRRMSAVFP